EIRPLLLNSGCVWPNLSLPHTSYSGLMAFQPSGCLAKSRTSVQPTGLLGQPSDSAMGFHMAITTGERTKFFVLVGSIRMLADLARASALPSSIKAPEAGLIKWALVRSLSTSSIDSPEPIAVALTWMRLPEEIRTLALLNAPVTSLSQFCFSEP